MIIRNVRRSDFDQWLPLWDGYNAFYGRSGATALPAEITGATWARFFDAYERYTRGLPRVKAGSWGSCTTFFTVAPS